MSRSYKKTPVVKEHESGKYGKRLANRKVRQYKQPLPNGKGYRKVFETCDIHDYIIRFSYARFKKEKESHEKELINGVKHRPYRSTEQNWAKHWKRK